jgi:hypothetical protein
MPALASGTRNPSWRVNRVCSSFDRRCADAHGARDRTAAPTPAVVNLRTVLRLGFDLDSFDDMKTPSDVYATLPRDAV